MKFLKNYYGLILVLCLSIFAVLPFFRPGFFPIHDDTQVARVFEMGKALKDGMFPVRWVSDLGYGYGYPIFNFYAPLSYYVGGTLTLMGFDALIATKIMMVIGIILSGVFMYLLARDFWGETGGAISALFYLYAPYHAVDVFVRGDVSEFWAYAFIPLIFYSCLRIYKKQKFRYAIIGSLGFAALILSHNLTAMMVTPFLLIALIVLIFVSLKNKNRSVIYYLISMIFLGIGLSSFYWLPALLEMKYTNILSQIGGGANFRDHFVCLQQLWNSPWGFGGSAPGCIDGLSFKIGKLHLVFSVLSIFVLIRLFNKDKNRFYVLLFCLVSLILTIFLTLTYSRSIWEFIRQMEFFQYPWRFLLLISFFSSVLAGSIIWYMEKLVDKKNRIFRYSLFSFVAIFLLFLNARYFIPQKSIDKTISDYTSEAVLKWNASKISDEYMPKDFIKPKSLSDVVSTKFVAESGTLGIADLTEKTQKIDAFIEVSENTKLLINIASFPSWNIYVDGKKISYKATNRGIEILLPKGFYQLDIKFEKTIPQLISEIISVASVLALVAGIIFSRKRLSL